MDKYQRRQLRRRDEFNGTHTPRANTSLQLTRLRQCFIRNTMEMYTPCPTTFLARVIELSRDIWFLFEEWDFRDIEYRNNFWNDRVFRVISWNEFVSADFERVRMELELQPDIYEHVRSDPIVKRALAKLQAERDERHIRRHAHACIRTLQRTAKIKSELLNAYPRMQAILRCKAIKEELYQNVYHPRRIEKLLETGGWEALDNFVGL